MKLELSLEDYAKVNISMKYIDPHSLLMDFLGTHHNAIPVIEAEQAMYDFLNTISTTFYLPDSTKNPDDIEYKIKIHRIENLYFKLKLKEDGANQQTT